jgi:hypothetical protein
MKPCVYRPCPNWPKSSQFWAWTDLNSRPHPYQGMSLTLRDVRVQARAERCIPMILNGRGFNERT